jgi:uncharacterized protein (UPF0261 family)
MTGKPRVLLLATLDTKFEEAAFLRRCLEDAGVEVVHLDASIRRTIQGAEISPDAVAAAAGTDMESVRALRHEGKCQAVMTEGAIKAAHAADKSAPLAGILAIGGSMGTTLATAVMRDFPYGLPKVMVSTLASGFTAPFVGTSDITMVNAVCDISGINTITRDVYRNAALAVAGMAHGYGASAADGKPLVLVSTLGTTERCSRRVRTELEARGFEVMVFHTLGAGGQTLDRIVRERPVAAVVDMSMVEINDFLHGGLCSAGPDRSKAALEMGVPVIFAPGNADFLVAGPIEDARKRFPGKRYHLHNAALTAVRTEMTELRALADHLATIIAAAKGPVSVFVPLLGFSNHDSPDGYLHDLTLPPQFAAYLSQVLPDFARPRTLNLHINDPEFADALVAQALAYAQPAAEPPTATVAQ